MQGNIAGSREHSRLLRAAQDSFLSSDAGHDSAGALAAPALLMGSILAQPISPEQLEQVQQCCGSLLKQMLQMLLWGLRSSKHI